MSLVIETRIIVSIPLAIWHICLICMMVYKIKWFTPKVEIMTPLLIFIFLFLSGGCVAWSVHAVGLYIYGDEWDSSINPTATILVCIQWTAFILSYVSGYMFLAANLFYVFKGSMFAMESKKWIFYVHGINIFIAMTLSTFAMISLHILNNNALSMLLLGINCVFVLCGSVHILILFLKNLFTFTMYDVSDDMALTPKKLIIIDLITKITVLSIINALIAGIIGAFASFLFIYHFIEWFIVIFWCVFGAFCMLLTLSVYMMLSANKRTYGFLCSKCHKGMNQICQSIARKHIARKVSHIQSTHQSTQHNQDVYL